MSQESERMNGKLMNKRLIAAIIAAALAVPGLTFNSPVAKAVVSTQYVALGRVNGSNTGCSNPGFGTDTYGSTYWAIKHALKSATDGGRVYLCPGTYDLTSGFRLGGWTQPNITIEGASRALTVLDGQGSLQVIHISSDTVGSLTVKNLTIQNADANEGSAICQNADVDLIVDRVSFLNNSADDYGAAIGCTSGNSLRVLNSYFEGNDAGSHGGAIDVHQDEGTVIRNSVFENNHSGNGGALGANGSDLDVQRCKFVDNVANNDGGAIWFTSSIISVFRNTFTGNSADQGGAIALRPGLRSQVRRIESANSFRGNVASHTRDRNVGSTTGEWD